MRKIIFLVIMMAISISALSAQNPDKPLIETMIKDLYFEGWMTGDTSKIGQAMHPTCHLKFYRDGQFTDISRADYLSRFKPKAKEAGVEGRIILLDITGNIASAKCELETPKAIFTDYFNIIRVAERWYIVDKISTRVDK
jgi:aldose sugar dehydrogenase